MKQGKRLSMERIRQTGLRFREKRGSSAVFLISILLSFLFVIGVLAEAAAGFAARSAADGVLDLAGESVLAAYDAELYDAYGIFAYRMGGEEAERMLRVFAEASFQKETGIDLFRLSLQRLSVEQDAFPLLNLDNLRQQILAYMEGRSLPLAADRLSGIFALEKLFDYSAMASRGEAAAERVKRAQRRLERLEDAEEEDEEAWEAAEREYGSSLEDGLSLEERVKRGLEEMNASGTATEGFGGLLPGQEDGVPENAAASHGAAAGSEEEREYVLRNEKVIRELPTVLMGRAPGRLPLASVSSADARESLLLDLYLGSMCVDRLHPGNAAEHFFAGELEYLLFGYYSQEKNYRKTEDLLHAFRCGLNLLHIYSSPEKTELLAATAAVLLPGPAAPIMQLALAFLWAEAETETDMKALLDGKRVPLLKSDADWNLSLENALAGVTDAAREDEGRGCGYEDYLFLFLCLAEEEGKLYRFLDLVDLNLKARYDKSFSCAQCFCGFALEAELRRRGSILSVFGERTASYRAVFVY